MSASLALMASEKFPSESKPSMAFNRAYPRLSTKREDGLKKSAVSDLISKMKMIRLGERELGLLRLNQAK